MEEKTKTKLLQQQRIAAQLKAMTVLLTLVLTAVGIALSVYAFSIRETGRAWYFIFFTWAAGVCCYLVLFFFWGVCTRIGEDRSFSLENAAAFHKMAFCGLAIAVIEAAQLAVFFFAEPSRLKLLIGAGELCLGLVFFVVCNALGKLVKNAYELKEDNDLTI